MPGHANFVGGPAARIRKLSSSSHSSHPNRRNTRLGGPSRIFKPRRENVQFDFPWVPALPDPHAGRRDEEEEEEMEEEEEGGGGWLEEREREGEKDGGGGGQREAKRRSVVLELLDNNSTLGGFEAGKQALLELDDWAGLHDSYISASDFLPPSPPPSRHHHQASSPHERDHHRRRSGKQKKVVSDDDEEWEDGRESRRRDAYMQEEDDDNSSPDRYVYEDPQEFPSHEPQHDTNLPLFDHDPHQPSHSPPRHQSHQPEEQHQHESQHQQQHQDQHPPNTHSSIATLPLSFSTNAQGVARPHPRTYPVPSSNSSDGDANVNARSTGASQFEGDPIVEEENEDLQIFGEGANDRDEQRMDVEISDASTTKQSTTKTKKKKTKRSSPDSQRITLGSSTIFHNHTSDLLASPPYVSPSPPAAGRPPRTIASQQLEKDEQRWRASQNERPLSTNDLDLPNPMEYLASRMGLPNISGPASPLRRSPRPRSRSSSLELEREKETEGRKDAAGAEVQREEEFEYQLNFDSRRWETHEGEEDEQSWNDNALGLGRRDDEEGGSSSQEIDVQQKHDQSDRGEWMKG